MQPSHHAPTGNDALTDTGVVLYCGVMRICYKIKVLPSNLMGGISHAYLVECYDLE